MYQVGEYLVYGMEGVCRVADVGRLKLSGVSRDRLYYTLAPIGKTDYIYIPVDTQVYMRRPLDRAEVDALLETLDALPACTDLFVNSFMAAWFLVSATGINFAYAGTTFGEILFGF